MLDEKTKVRLISNNFYYGFIGYIVDKYENSYAGPGYIVMLDNNGYKKALDNGMSFMQFFKEKDVKEYKEITSIMPTE